MCVCVCVVTTGKVIIIIILDKTYIYSVSVQRKHFSNAFCFYFSILSRGGLKVCSYSIRPASQIVLTPDLKEFLRIKFARQKAKIGGLSLSRLLKKVEKKDLYVLLYFKAHFT